MLSRIIKSLALLTIFILVFFKLPGKMYASAPTVTGKVLTAGTNAPVVGVWVKWTDAEGDYWYMQTDNTGTFTFPEWATLGNTLWTQYIFGNIDSNLDGVADTTQAYLTPEIRASADGGYWNGFACTESPHTWEVVQPVGWPGTFSSITNKNINNGNGTLNIGDIIYTPTFSISGNVFNDYNKDGLKNNGEVNNTSPFSLSITPNAGTITTNADGTYSITGLAAGTYTVSYSTLPNGFRMTSPLNGPPPSFTVTVGTGICNTNVAPGASCQ